MNHILVSRFFVDHKQVEIEGRVGGTGRVVGGGGRVTEHYGVSMSMYVQKALTSFASF